MNIENIEAFVYVIHYGSFNKAAEVLFLSQPSVTARIQSLERELDCRLFDRIGKQVSLTDEGRRFLPYAQQLLQTFQKSKIQLKQKRTLPNELRIGCTVSVSNYVIPELVPKMKRKYPDVNFKLTTATTEDIVNKVLNRELDVGFVRNISHPNLLSTKVYEDPIRLYVYEDHPFIGSGIVSIEEIGEHPLVFFECGSLDWMRIHRLFASMSQPPNIEFQTDNLETAKKLVLQRVGIAFLPSLCVEQEVRENKLFPIEFPETSGISLQTNIIALNGESGLFFNNALDICKGITTVK
ncbi:LysR family transcriptional regulator [Paenibacillus aceris]|uniref:DNA-binding transcriptional LysR family regulator n=1 Tax=Paenibacillus aceris TaxID=869555 RepID=A0ABS4I3E6_9BACL|nr:LysR family transcriptional regulator [Paenibacillus aceris]MBP1964689.1 DNA-binding transcriptional LysR family regulator [Paenibacillus aceris]NHW33676.1 LysR family transcriptional regulator [Paenibacillus aceris]